MRSFVHQADFVRGEVPDMIANGVMRVFMPHGLGHFVGVDVHDPGYSSVCTSIIVPPVLCS